jgi:hypothetical protein
MLANQASRVDQVLGDHHIRSQQEAFLGVVEAEEHHFQSLAYQA